jgi:hypothetical protein
MPIFSLDKFKRSTLGRFNTGTWTVAYHDRSHLPTDTYVSLGTIEIEEYTQKGDAFFYFYPNSYQQIRCFITDAWSKGKVDGNKDSKAAAKVILDQLSESMVRLGLVQPNFEIDGEKFITERKFAIVVLDTNALRDGAIRHLKEQLGDVQLWTIIPTVALMEIGERIAYITKKDREGRKGQNSGLIRFRPQVTIAPQEVKWIQKNFPTETLELAPELLRTFRGYETGQKNDPSKEPDRVSINDRLILEGIKDLRRQRSLLEGIYLMSNDKDVSRLARLEGINTIYPAIPDIHGLCDRIYSLRYSLESRTYISCSIHRFLWDLTHVFSQIKVQSTSGSQEGQELKLSYYYPSKLVNAWIDDKLEVTDLGSNSTTDTI